MSGCCSVGSRSDSLPGASPCPACGARSKRVDALTVKSLVRHLSFRMELAQYYFCEAPACDVVYFPRQSGAPTFRRPDLLVPVGQKDPSDGALICYCFGVRRREIWEEVQATGCSTFLERIRAEVKAGNCACEVKNPSGKCCLGNITRVVQDARQGLESQALTGAAASERGRSSSAGEKGSARS